MLKNKNVKKELITWLDGITEFCLCAFIFTLPFSKSMVEIFFTLALICWVAKRWIEYDSRFTVHGLRNASFRIKISTLIKAFKPVKTNLNLPITAFVFIGFLSTLTSVSFSLSLEGFFFKLFEWIMLYFIVAETINNKKKLNRLLIVMLASMVLIGIDAIFQFLTGADFMRHYASMAYRLRASFGNANSFAGWLVIMVPLVFCFAYFGINKWIVLPEKYNWIKKSIRPILWITSALLIFCLALTYTRGAWMGVILSLIFLGVFKSKKLLVFLLIALLAFSFIAPQRIKQRISLTFQSSKTRANLLDKTRYSLWHEALNIIKDFPLIGCGLNTYAIVAPDYKITKKGGIYPHNSYLHMAAESGLLGLGTFIWIMITLFRTSLANLKRIGHRFHSVILIGLLAGLFGFLAHSFVDTNIYTLQLGNLMWFIMGLIVAVQKVALKNGSEITG